MRIEIDKAVRPARRLRTLLKQAPSELTPEYVHTVRTQARRLEAIVHAISFTHERRARRLLKRVKPLRKAAGGVRDMDVMIAKVLSVADGMGGDRRDALLRLTGQMSAVRERNAERLRRLIERRGKTLCSKLKSYASRMGKAEPDELGVSMAAPQMLTAQLQHWPRLRAGNLHEFRIQAKELRYMLQLMPEMDEHTLNAFARVKDVAGEWHDWLQVHEYAGKVLDAKEDHEILRRLGEIEHEKLRAALVTANAIRHNGLAAL
ncbi:MAG: CHAD domain-containing protein [Terracidiphilus sp.]